MANRETVRRSEGYLNKYRNKKTVVDGITFDSQKEAKRYGELKLLEHAGVITDLQLQPPFKLEVHGVKICTYRADFRYTENGKDVVEDVKGVLTPVYRIKKKLMFAIYGIEIKEI